MSKADVIEIEGVVVEKTAQHDVPGRAGKRSQSAGPYTAEN